MRLKEIKPEMVIHCKNETELTELLKEAERLGYVWYPDRKPTNRPVDCGMTIHFWFAGGQKIIAFSNKTEGVTEFSDLILPELTAEEAVEWLCKHYTDGEYDRAFKGDFILGELLDRFTPEDIVKNIAKWKAAHEKKEPEIETVNICRIIEIQPDGKKRCVHEEDIKPDPELPYGSEQLAVHEILKCYCMEHEGEYMAVHEVVSRVKKCE